MIFLGKTGPQFNKRGITAVSRSFMGVERETLICLPFVKRCITSGKTFKTHPISAESCSDNGVRACKCINDASLGSTRVSRPRV